MRNRPRKSLKIEGLTFDHTSSLNKFFLCECGRKFEKKTILIRHVSGCDGVQVKHNCSWCNLSFQSRGNLVLHLKCIHGDESFKKIQKQKKFECNVCDAKYDYMYKLKYHIRGSHFNLLADTPRCETKPINQVWFETVLNSPNLVEIKKTGPNTLVMKSMSPNTTVELSDHNKPEKIDLHSVYPTGCRKVDTECKICKKFIKGRDLKKHIQESHQKDFAKHQCNNCNMLFKRSYLYLKHVCNKVKTRKKKVSLKQYRKEGVEIRNESSLCPNLVD